MCRRGEVEVGATSRLVRKSSARESCEVAKSTRVFRARGILESPPEKARERVTVALEEFCKGLAGVLLEFSDELVVLVHGPLSFTNALACFGLSLLGMSREPQKFPASARFLPLGSLKSRGRRESDFLQDFS